MKMSFNQLVAVFFLVILYFDLNSEASEQFNQIDGFTSSSIYESLKIKPSKVYKNYAVITWSEDWEDELKVIAYRLRWGTQPGVFTDSINLKGFIKEVENIDTLLSLKENTSYYAQFYRDYNHNDEFSEDFRFNTPPLPTIPPVSIKTLKPSTLNSNIVNTIASIEIYTASGKRVSISAFDTKRGVSTISAKIKTPGLYIVNLTNRNNQVISSEKLLIEN
jgi:hypothetical protein